MVIAEKTPLKITEGRYGHLRVLPQSHEVGQKQRYFPYEEWVQAIKSIKEARTYREQKIAIATGVLSVGSYSESICPSDNGSRAKLSNNIFTASLALDGTDEALVGRLRSIKTRLPNVTGLAVVGYQTPDNITPYPAFSVLDVVEHGITTHHEVVHDPEDSLSDLYDELSYRVANALAHVLDDKYPGFDIFDKLDS